MEKKYIIAGGKIMDKLKTAEIFDTKDIPFFNRNNIRSFHYENKSVILPDILENSDYTLRLFYQITNNRDKELHLENWTFLSIDRIIKNYDLYKKYGVNNVIDIAEKYMGWGWFCIVSYDVNLKCPIL